MLLSDRKIDNKVKIEDYGLQPTKKVVVPMTIFTALTLYKISETKARYVEFVYTDVKVNTDPTRGLLKMLYQKHSESVHATFGLTVETREKNGGGRPEECKRFIDLLDDFKAKYLPTGTEEKTW